MAVIALPAPRDLPFLDGVLRQVDYWAILWSRTWRGVLASSFLSPFLYVLAMGVLLGGFVEADADQLEGATSYLAFVVPGLIAAHAMQTAVSETTFPVMGMIKWRRIYESMLATPLQPRHVAGAHLATVAVHLAVTCGIYTAVMAPFGVYESWWGTVPGVRLAGPVRHGVRDAGLRLHHPELLGGGVRRALPAGRVPAVPVLGRVLPGRPTSATSARGSRGSPRCGTASTSPGCSRSTR